MEQHIVRVSKTGQVQIEVRGVKGTSCQDATRAIERALGTTTADTPTAEAYEQANEQLQGQG